MFENLPEQRFADMMDSLSIFSGFQKQIGFFDEDRLTDSERAIAVICQGDNPANFVFFEDVNITVVVVSKKIKSDDVETRLLARNIQSKIQNIFEYEDIFNINSTGFSSRIQLDSGRVCYELNFAMQSNYCPSL